MDAYLKLLRDAPWETWAITSLLGLVFVLVVYSDVVVEFCGTFLNELLGTTEDYDTDQGDNRHAL